MGNNQNFFQCSKTSKTLFNPKIGQNSSLNILKKTNSDKFNLPVASELSPKSDNEFQSFSTNSLSQQSQFYSNQHVKCLDNYTIERKLFEKKTNGGSLMLIRCKKDRSQLYVLKIVNKSSLVSINEESYLQCLKAFIPNPYVCDVKHSFICQSNLYLILEYCPGGLLIELLQKQRRFSEDVARFYLAEIILALESQNFSHFRYLSIENLLLSHEGHIKLANFGGEKCVCEEIAKSEENSEEEQYKDDSTKYLKMDHFMKKHSLKAIDLESLSHIAPEMFEKLAVHNRKSDLWMLGILLFQMITGESPFSLNKKTLETITLEKIQKFLKEKEPTFPKGMSEECRGLIWGLLRKDGEERIGAKNWKEIKLHLFFEGFQWKDLGKKIIPAPYSMNMHINSLKKKEEFKKFWKIQENLCKRPTVYLARTFFIGSSGSN